MKPMIPSSPATKRLSTVAIGLAAVVAAAAACYYPYSEPCGTKAILCPDGSIHNAGCSSSDNKSLNRTDGSGTGGYTGLSTITNTYTFICSYTNNSGVPIGCGSTTNSTPGSIPDSGSGTCTNGVPDTNPEP